MKLILTSTIPNVGQAGDIKEVSQGYARNYLLPRRLAVPATPENIQKFEAERRRAAKKQARRTELGEQQLQQLSGRTVRLEAKANEEGKLFGSVQPADILQALRLQLEVALPDSALQLKQPMKTLGQYTITVKVGSSQANLNIEIVRAA